LVFLRLAGAAVSGFERGMGNGPSTAARGMAQLGPSFGYGRVLRGLLVDAIGCCGGFNNS
jgi:hypothetical protein